MTQHYDRRCGAATAHDSRIQNTAAVGWGGVGGFWVGVLSSQMPDQKCHSAPCGLGKLNRHLLALGALTAGGRNHIPDDWISSWPTKIYERMLFVSETSPWTLSLLAGPALSFTTGFQTEGRGERGHFTGIRTQKKQSNNIGYEQL